MNLATAPAFGRSPWASLLVWGLLLFALYILKDVFLVAFLTFLLSYLVRAIVVSLARRLGREGTGIERWLTLGTFAAIVGLIWALGSLIGPQFITQGRLLVADVEHLEPQEALDHFLGRTVGAWLFSSRYGGPDDPRYQAGLQQFMADGRIGEGAFAGFARVQSRVQGGFEVAYEAAERQRLRHEFLRGGADSKRFEQWLRTVKVPALLAGQGSVSPADQGEEDSEGQKIGSIIQQIQADPARRARLVKEWEDSVIDREWQRLKASPGYLSAFRAWYAGEQGQLGDIPYDADTYLALRDAYPEGMAAFNQVYRAKVSGALEDKALLQKEFQEATRADLARVWWSSNPAAASLKQHLSQDASEVAAAVASRIANGVRSVIAVPAQIGTALLLTILITLDMTRLKQGAQHLRDTRIAALYARIVPNLAAVARLIGRSFAAQGLIAVFNTLLTFLLFRIIGLHNELLLCSVVFLASFIPVLGVVLAAIPITLQALLQPDGSLMLALYALLGIGVIHAIEATLLSPKIVGKILHLHPVLVMVVLVIGEQLFGIWGLLLGVPVAVFIIHAVLAEPIPGIYEPGDQTSAAD